MRPAILAILLVAPWPTAIAFSQERAIALDRSELIRLYAIAENENAREKTGLDKLSAQGMRLLKEKDSIIVVLSEQGLWRFRFDVRRRDLERLEGDSNDLGVIETVMASSQFEGLRIAGGYTIRASADETPQFLSQVEGVRSFPVLSFQPDSNTRMYGGLDEEGNAVRVRFQPQVKLVEIARNIETDIPSGLEAELKTYGLKPRIVTKNVTSELTADNFLKEKRVSYSTVADGEQRAQVGARFEETDGKFSPMGIIESGDINAPF